MSDAEIIGAGGALAGLGLIFVLFYVAIFAFIIACQWKMFAKAHKTPWTCLVPIYNVYQQFDIAYGDGWKCLLLLIPFVNIFVSIQYSLKLAKAFGQSTAFGVGLIFLAPVFTAIIAFSKNIHYVGPYEDFK